jgi:hypothetical protein
LTTSAFLSLSPLTAAAASPFWTGRFGANNRLKAQTDTTVPTIGPIQYTAKCSHDVCSLLTNAHAKACPITHPNSPKSSVFLVVFFQSISPHNELSSEVEEKSSIYNFQSEVEPQKEI